MIPGVEINIFLLIFVGLGAGILSGFAGVGGAFVVTPALIVLGFPANLAVGTSLAWVVGKSIIAVYGHRKLGNIDMKLGLSLLVAAAGGVEVGVRVLNWANEIGLADEVVLSISVCMLLTVGIYTFIESIKRKQQLDRMLERGEKPAAMSETFFSQMLQEVKIPPMLHLTRSGITVSLWIVLGVGFFIGVLSGLIGVGGGFIMVPSLVYLIGIPSFMAVGTDLFQIIFSAAYATIRHAMSGNVIIFAAFIMVIASSIGVQFGVLTTRYTRGVSVRIILGISILLFAVGTMLKLLGILMGDAVTWPGIASIIITFGSLGLTVLLIITLYLLSFRYRNGKSVPTWAESLMAKPDKTTD